MIWLLTAVQSRWTRKTLYVELKSNSDSQVQLSTSKPERFFTGGLELGDSFETLVFNHIFALPGV